MIIIDKDDYKNFKYTKIKVPITLNECPSDHENSRYYIETVGNSIFQQNCYIGEQRVEQIQVKRLRKANVAATIAAPQWEVELIIAESKTEDDVLEILDELCNIFSLACAQSPNIFQHSGLYGFSYRSIDVERRYAAEDRVFGEVDLTRYGLATSCMVSSICENIFMLPEEQSTRTTILQKLDKAFLRAMKSSDAVSRYILLYYLFEIMYETVEYRRIKSAFENTNIGCGKRDIDKKRSEILYQYLRQEFGITNYSYFFEQYVLSSDILRQIIKTRNDLTHRADTSKITEMMYYHMIPILQCVLKAQNT